MRNIPETMWNGTLKWLGRHLTQGFLLWEFQWCISWSHLTHFGAHCKTYVHSGAFMSHFQILWYEWRFKRHYFSAFYSTIFGEKDTPRKFMMGRYQKLLAAKCPACKWWSKAFGMTPRSTMALKLRHRTTKMYMKTRARRIWWRLSSTDSPLKILRDISLIKMTSTSLNDATPLVLWNKATSKRNFLSYP